MAKIPTSNYGNGQTFTCSVSATVYPRGDYEYAVSIFGTADRLYEPLDAGSRNQYTKFNVLLESKYPIHFQPYPTEDYGTILIPFVYADSFENPKAFPLHINALMHTNYEHMYTSGKYIRGNIDIFMDTTVKNSGGGGGGTIDNYRTVGQLNRSYRTDETSITTRAITSMKEFKVNFWSGKYPDPPEITPHTANAPLSIIHFYDIKGETQPGSETSTFTVLSYYPSLINGELKDGDYTSRYTSQIGYVNNPTYSSYAEWRAACEALRTGS